ncbi:FecR family protein [Sphingopyxis fribergensis]
MSRADNRQERIDAEAAGWLAAIECGTADAAAFEQWRSGDPARALAFIRVSQVNRSLDALRETGLAGRAIQLEEAAPDEAVPDRRKLLKLGVAGALAAGLGGLGWTYAAAAHEAETGVGERRRIVVARGIALELNTDSHVEWERRDGMYRFELLRGEMMLERQSGSAPCSLHCGPSQIALAAGGLLNARSVASGVDFSVLEGEASLRTSGSGTVVRVPTLQKARVAAGVAPTLSTLSERDAGAVAAWQKGQLQFNGESLADAVAEYNRYLSRPIEIGDPSIRDIRMGGRFSTTDPADFCRALTQIYGISAHFERDRIRLIRSGPEKI